jgi:hypothetical protein
MSLYHHVYIIEKILTLAPKIGTAHLDIAYGLFRFLLNILKKKKRNCQFKFEDS